MIMGVTLSCNSLPQAIEYKKDDVSQYLVTTKNKQSHLKIYLPSIPYSYIMRLINGTLVRLNDSKNGWEYFLAKKHEKIDALTYDFYLREDVRFQDGSLLDASSVVQNFEAFQKGPFTYTDIHNRLKKVERLSSYKIRIHLKKPYGMLLNDLARINMYTSHYLEKYGWSNNIVAENTKVPGPYGSGPYMLESGFARGLNQSEKLVLKANKYYFQKDQPFIQTITVYTKLPIEEVIEQISEKEGYLDMAVIPFDKKTEIVNSKYAKLVMKESSFNLSFHMNLMKENSALQDIKIRQAINQAINQKRLIKFAYKNEGKASAYPLSAYSHYGKALSSKFVRHPKTFFSQEELYKILNGLKLNVVTQDRFISLLKGIEFQLNRYGVTFQYDITSDESYVLNKLLTNRKHVHDWDLLIWGNDDWYGHPWASFFTLYTKNQWSAIKKDDILDAKLETLFELHTQHPLFQKQVDDILTYCFEKSYMISIPTPNFLLALNKEVFFEPSSVAILKLWEAKLSNYHWSIRQGALPDSRLEFILPKRLKYAQ
jgi:ABC-type transport system substrate-binding protein